MPEIILKFSRFLALMYQYIRYRTLVQWLNIWVLVVGQTQNEVIRLPVLCASLHLQYFALSFAATESAMLSDKILFELIARF